MSTKMSQAKIVLDFWNSSESTFPRGMRVYNQEEQAGCERQFEALVSNIKKKAKKANGSYQALRLQKEELLTDMADFFRFVFDYSDEQLQLIISEPMIKSSWTFLKTARRYDPEISLEDAFQAMRNVWIMNGLQLLMGSEIKLTPSVFAYSMLYPYTDNYLDDKNISTWNKIAFVDRFSDRLAGKLIEPQNSHEERIYDMVELIESEWDRALYPGLYQSLLNIHTAQASSVQLIAGIADLNFDERLTICIEKGGTSVVADGYLLSGTISADVETFLYVYGAYLQLMDDLQDLKTDLDDGVLTAFAYSAKDGVVDEIWNQVSALGDKVIEQAELMQSDLVPVFQTLMKRSVDLFMVDAVRTNKTFYTDDFVIEMEKRLPLGPEFIKKKSGSLEILLNPMFEKVLQQAIALSGEDEFAFLNKKSLLKQQA